MPCARRSTCASRLTGGAPGSYPGTDWVRDPGRAPRCRSSTGWSASPSSWRMRVRIPSVAPRRRGPTDKAPDYETGGCRFDPCRRHQSTRRSSAEQSAALRRRRSHVRIVPARPASRDGREDKTPGPQPGGRGSIPRRGTRALHEAMPGGRAARRPVVTRKTGVRAPPWQLSIKTATSRGRRPTARTPVRHIGDEGSNPSDHTRAGEVLREGRSARTREAAGSIPAAGPTPPDAKTGGYFIFPMNGPARARPPVAEFPGGSSTTHTWSRSSDGGAAG